MKQKWKKKTKTKVTWEKPIHVGRKYKGNKIFDKENIITKINLWYTDPTKVSKSMTNISIHYNTKSIQTKNLCEEQKYQNINEIEWEIFVKWINKNENIYVIISAKLNHNMPVLEPKSIKEEK